MATDRDALPRRRRDVVRALLACGIAVGLGSVATQASWTSSAATGAGTITAGQLDLVVNGDLATVNNLDGTRTEASWTINDFLTGEFVPLTFTVTNGGSGSMPLDLRFDAYVTHDYGGGVDAVFYDGGTPAGTVNLSAPAADDYRKVGCTGGTVVKSLTLPAGEAAAAPIQSTKLRLNVGESRTYCVRLTMAGGAVNYTNTSRLAGKNTFVIAFRATQDGAP